MAYLLGRMSLTKHEFYEKAFPQTVGINKKLNWSLCCNPVCLCLTGSPFTQEIGEGVLPPAHGDGLYRGEEDKPAIFYIDARGMSGEPSVQVDGQCRLWIASMFHTKVMSMSLTLSRWFTFHTKVMSVSLALSGWSVSLVDGFHVSHQRHVYVTDMK